MSEPSAKEEPKKDEPTYKLTTDQDPVVTRHRLGEMEYEASVGMLPLKDEFGEVEAGVFFISYTRLDTHDQPQRPIMFSFNGGPGSSSVWLHYGTVGPKRVKMEPGGFMPSPPYELVDNPESWLEHTDLVFIDPVGTGFSRPAKKDAAKSIGACKVMSRVWASSSGSTCPATTAGAHLCTWSARAMGPPVRAALRAT